MNKRRFTHVEGFKDGTKYVEYHDNGTVFIVSDKVTKTSGFHYLWHLDDALKRVERGVWKELEIKDE